ncbi:cationic amino acid transporter 3, mitochondrial-like isoform X1 [Nicotiana tabacum]|uniref:Cationic amino acid transporter 3, mitochondrial-like isoform X1 n=1 Tax=Nicotiana tabacum TaxID=4097 RepID=A0A1S4D6P8_TOBAC|nr:PREDICTED: cationic amino acid transporter 3, mitochondrial-like isoform X1 [Nicotiana tabacum]XP_016508980.1 PREDICTED: cationic amino acid transporter 3, mitochondrial-like isoform X1 [Nicotiana tabacum]XP_016508981.1 PREDICTED: cationic amino acid transporter 3, mitochondrial-like isoform X1 [Nicotiana tabacum]
MKEKPKGMRMEMELGIWIKDQKVLMFIVINSGEGKSLFGVLPCILRFILSGVAGMLVICFLAVLSSVDQADTNESFTKSGGFICPFVPFLPVATALILHTC